ncbi:MAG: RNA-binding transcriptional accessory protein [Anaerolineaceae bacterium]|nr:RNA-binding transcriptional accessory protein [Anaerolineaceae bacterium]
MTDREILATIASELKLAATQVAATAALFDDGNTIPFVARYRKEMTGGLDEEQLRQLEARLGYLRRLSERQAAVLKSIEEQGKLTPELAAAIEAATTLQAVEDLYLPYKPKRRTRATIARERGLEPLADLLLQQQDDRPLEELAASFLSDEVEDAAAALAGARDILAERFAEDAAVRGEARKLAANKAVVVCQLAGDEAEVDPGGKYRLYHDVALPLDDVQPHQWLAIERGEAEGALHVRLDLPEDDILDVMEISFLRGPRRPIRDQVEAAIADGYKRLLAPSVERDVRAGEGEAADEHAIQVFTANLRKLLLQPPLRGKVVMGLDPGYRTGCKVAVVDATGKVLGTDTIYPHEPVRRWDEAKKALTEAVKAAGVGVVAIGNGTASRETEQLVAELIEEHPGLRYAMVSEAGASVYSASPLARAELPNLDVSLRGAVSIARRLQDPLAELVKIDPQSIGVGMYQHDVDQKKLAEALDAVVESVVNYVGVDVNTASPALLGYVAGLSKAVAANVVALRDDVGPFKKRSDLKKVKGLGPRAYQQAAGFLRVPESANPLDNTAIHPESYPIVERLMDLAATRLKARDMVGKVQAVRDEMGLAGLAELLDVGEPTLVDILDALARPGRDPREDLPPPILRQDVLKMEDLREGMRLKGTVRNVVDFGAFVDIGVKQDGLVHVSKMADRYVRNPFEVVSVGDVVDVVVTSVDLERGRIGLSMRD